MNPVREVRQARWNEPVVMELGVPGRRGAVFPTAEPAVVEAVGPAQGLISEGMRRRTPARAARK